MDTFIVIEIQIDGACEWPVLKCLLNFKCPHLIIPTPLLGGLSLRITCMSAQKYMHEDVYQSIIGTIPGQEAERIRTSINSWEWKL